MEAWQFLGQPGSAEDIKKAFDMVDIDGSGLVDKDEFIFSIMGEKAANYGLLADLEKASEALDTILRNFDALQGELKSVGESAEARARKNKMIRARLENVKAEVGATVNGLITDMMGMNPEDFMTEAEIDRALTEAFNKFDEDKSGQLGLWEFQQAWFFLELKGSEEEIRE